MTEVVLIKVPSDQMPPIETAGDGVEASFVMFSVMDINNSFEYKIDDV